jgi:aryl-alcohol dehydrogenase-like predicted oxidoreductase
LGIGGAVFGRDCDQNETIRIIREAEHQGINFIDTADVYNGGLSEEWIGSALRDSRQRWIIATKVGVRGSEPRRGKGRKELILKRVEESLRRLKTEYIDLYQMHHFDPETPLEETLDTLHGLVEQGKARAVGVSNYTTEQLRDAWQTVNSCGLSYLSSTQTLYNLFKRESEAALLPFCGEARIGVIAYSVLARGVLSGKYRLVEAPPADSRASSTPAIRADLTRFILGKIEALKEFAQACGHTVAHLALAWVLRRSEISAVLIGVRNATQLRQDVSGLDWPFLASELKEIDRIVGDLAGYTDFFGYGPPPSRR